MSQADQTGQPCPWPSYERRPTPPQLLWLVIIHYATNTGHENDLDRQLLDTIIEYLEIRFRTFREEIIEDMNVHIRDLRELGTSDEEVRTLEWRSYIWSNNMFYTNHEEILCMFGEDEIFSQRLYERIKLLEILRYYLVKSGTTLCSFGFTQEILYGIVDERVCVQSHEELYWSVASLLLVDKLFLGIDLTWGRTELCDIRWYLEYIFV